MKRQPIQSPEPKKTLIQVFNPVPDNNGDDKDNFEDHIIIIKSK